MNVAIGGWYIAHRCVANSESTCVLPERLRKKISLRTLKSPASHPEPSEGTTEKKKKIPVPRGFDPRSSDGQPRMSSPAQRHNGLRTKKPNHTDRRSSVMRPCV